MTDLVAARHRSSTGDGLTAWPENPVLVEVRRGGLGTDVLESVHRGALVVLGADGAPLLEVGDVSRPVLPRSSNKPVQATALLSAGWRPRNDRELAIGGASDLTAHRCWRSVTSPVRCCRARPTSRCRRRRCCRRAGGRATTGSSPSAGPPI